MSDNVPHNSKFLVGANQIMSYIGIARPTFYKLIRLRLPVVIIDNRYYGHTDNIDEFLRMLTKKGTAEIRDDVD